MTADTLDPLIHVPARLQIMATLAALPKGDALSFTRLQDMIGLTPGNLASCLALDLDCGARLRARFRRAYVLLPDALTLRISRR